MRLPPEQQNEPEWLRVQRRRQREESNSNYGRWAAASVAAIPYAIVEALETDPGSSELFDVAKFMIAATLATIAIIVVRRSARGTFQRGFASWSFAIHGLTTAIFAVGLWQL